MVVGYFPNIHKTPDLIAFTEQTSHGSPSAWEMKEENVRFSVIQNYNRKFKATPRDGSAVKSTYCSCTIELTSGSSQPLVNPVPVKSDASGFHSQAQRQAGRHTHNNKS